MKKLILTIYFMFGVLCVYGQDTMNDEHKATVAEFIDIIKKGNKDALAQRVNFPFKREYLVPSIKNEAEFLKRYDEIFDKKLIAAIVNSSPDKDWSAVGWRGMMLNNGVLWLDYDGTLLGVNYQSDFEKKMRAQLIAEDKKSVHPSISQFERPVQILKTAKFLIRIDDLGNGSHRYASWSSAQKMTDKPDIIITNGEFVAEGSGGNHSYVFRKGNYRYECAIILISEDDGPHAYLTVYKNDKEIVSQPAEIVVK